MINGSKISVHRFIATTLFRMVKEWPHSSGNINEWPLNYKNWQLKANLRLLWDNSKTVAMRCKNRCYVKFKNLSYNARVTKDCVTLIISLFMLSKIFLLIIPISDFVGLMSLHVGLFMKSGLRSIALLFVDRGNRIRNGLVRFLVSLSHIFL